MHILQGETNCNNRKKYIGFGDSYHSAVLLLKGMSGHGNSRAMRYSEHQNDNQVDILREGWHGNSYFDIFW